MSLHQSVSDLLARTRTEQTNKPNKQTPPSPRHRSTSTARVRSRALALAAAWRRAAVRLTLYGTAKSTLWVAYFLD